MFFVRNLITTSTLFPVRKYTCRQSQHRLDGNNNNIEEKKFRACPVDKIHRNQCRYCRLQKCLQVNMNRDGKDKICKLFLHAQTIFCTSNSITQLKHSLPSAVQHERGPRSSTLRKQRQDKLLHQQQQQQHRHIPYHNDKMAPSPCFEPIRREESLIERLVTATNKCLLPTREQVCILNHVAQFFWKKISFPFKALNYNFVGELNFPVKQRSLH